MKPVFPLFLLPLLAFASCQTDGNDDFGSGRGTLSLSLSRAGMPEVVSRAVDADLTLEIRKPNGSLFKSYAAGSVPSAISLEAGVVYTLRAFTPNQSTWQTANNGRGEGCFWGETTVSVGEDETVYCVYAVPMTNYAVGLSLPPAFSQLFSAYTFTLSSGGRSVTLQDGEAAYFLPTAGFTYQLRATNTDGVTNTQSEESYSDVTAGKLYQVKYSYGGSSAVEF